MVGVFAPKDGFVAALLVADGANVSQGDPLIEFEVDSEQQDRRRAIAQRRLVEAFGDKLTDEYIGAARVDLESALAKASKAVEIATIIYEAAKIRYEIGEITEEVFTKDDKALFESIEMKKVAESKLRVFDLETASQRSLHTDKLAHMQSEIEFADKRAVRMTLLSPENGTFKGQVGVNSFAKLGSELGAVK